MGEIGFLLFKEKEVILSNQETKVKNHQGSAQFFITNGRSIIEKYHNAVHNPYVSTRVHTLLDNFLLNWPTEIDVEMFHLNICQNNQTEQVREEVMSSNQTLDG